MEFTDICHFFAELSPQPTLAIDGLNHTVRYINNAGRTLLGEGTFPYIGAHINSVLPVGGSISEHILKGVHETGKPNCIVEQEIDGPHVRYWSYYCWPVVGGHKTTLGVIIQIIDSTETATFRKRSTNMNQSLLLSSLHQLELRKTAEKLNEELNRASAAKSQFLAAMSHEIRTPLNAIVGFSDLLLLPGQIDLERVAYGEQIKRHSHVLLRLIDDILDLAKVEAGQLSIETITIDLGELLSDVRLVMEHSASSKGIDFSMTLDPALPTTLVSDPTRLKQILINIIGNAVKFTSKGTVKVEVLLDKPLQKIRFLVSDTGEGLSPDQAIRLFKPFTQADSATTRKFGGTGLGLDLSRRLAHALHGDVTILESALGQGSTFEVSIALESPTYGVPWPAPSLPKSAELSRLDGVRILVAEDAPDNRFLIARFLGNVGAKVDFAEDGEQAIKLAFRKTYDIIMMDIQMPNIDGYTATSKIREMDCRIPIVAMTAHAMRSDIEHCLRVGCSDHLAKPFSMAQIVDKIAGLVGVRIG